MAKYSDAVNSGARGPHTNAIDATSLEGVAVPTRAGEHLHAATIAHLATLALIVAFGAAVRFFALALNPVGFNQDEAVNGYDAYSLGLTLRDHHGHLLPSMFESFGDWASPLLTYLTVPFVKIFGLSVWSTRFPVALLGTASIVVFYLLARALYGRRDIALHVAALVATAPWSITVSRIAIPPSIVPLFAGLFALIVVYALRPGGTRNLASLLQVAVAGALLTYAYPTQKLFVPVMILATAFIFLRSHWQKAIFMVAAYAVCVLPIYLPILSDPVRYNGRYEALALSGSPLHVLLGFIARYFLTLSPMALFGTGDRDVLMHVPGFGTNAAFLTIFFYIGVAFTVFAAFRGPTPQSPGAPAVQRTSARFMLVWLFAFPIPASLTTSYFHVLRDIHGFPIVTIMAAAGIAGMFAIFSHNLRSIALAIAAVTIAVSGIDFAVYYFTDYRGVSKTSFQYGIADAFHDLKAAGDQCPKLVVDNAINQPYIYYLFYDKIDPRTLDTRQLDRSVHPEVARVGDVRFEPVSAARVAQAKNVANVSDGWRTWYSIYRSVDGTCFLRQIPPTGVEPAGAEHQSLIGI